MIDVLKSSTLEGIQVGDPVVFASKGVYRVDNIEKINIGTGEQDCIVLSHLYNKTITKTFLPVSQLATSGLRKIQNIKSWNQFTNDLEQIELRPEEFKINSNTKMNSYEKRILRGDLTEIIRVFLCVTLDMDSTGIADKRYVAFKERLREVASQEISLMKSQTLEESLEDFDRLLKVQTSH